MNSIHKYELDVAGARLPKELKMELNALFKKNLHISQNKTRHTSSTLSLQTQRVRSMCMIAAIEDIFNHGKFKISSLYNLKEKHFEFIVDYWVSKSQTRDTIENKIMYMATLAKWLRKANVVKDPEKYANVKQLPKKCDSKVVERSWESLGIDANDLIGRISFENQHIGLQLMLQVTFGLKLKESMLLRPHNCIVRKNDDLFISIEIGSKDGRRTRNFKVQHESQLELIELAKLYVNRTTHSTVPSEFTLAEWTRKFSNTMTKFNIHKKGPGATLHGLQNEYLNKLFERVTDKESEVQEGEEPKRDILSAARQILTNHFSHVDSIFDKVNSNCGGQLVLKVKTTRDLTNEQVLQAVTDADGNKMKAAEKLGCARSYLYKRLNEMDHVYKLN